jgi:hypothetical protein
MSVSWKKWLREVLLICLLGGLLGDELVYFCMVSRGAAGVLIVPFAL